MQQLPTWLYRGYTGHEHLDAFALINMNARLYDPMKGRMLSPDNYTQGGSTQGFNPFSYAHNNPLKFIDADGNNPLLVAIVIGALIGGGSYTLDVALSDGGFKNWNWGQFAKSVGIGAVSGAFTYGIGTALGPAFQGVTNFSSFVKALPTEVIRAGLHGVTQGILGGFNGQEFGQGFGLMNIGLLILIEDKLKKPLKKLIFICELRIYLLSLKANQSNIKEKR